MGMNRFYEEVAVFSGGPVTLEQVPLAGVVPVSGGGGEDEEPPGVGGGYAQDSSPARSAVCWAALA